MGKTTDELESLEEEYASIQGEARLEEGGGRVSSKTSEMVERTAGDNQKGKGKEGESSTRSEYKISRRVKMPTFKGDSDEDADTHLARFEEMLRANHEQNDTARLELFPSSLDKGAFVWYTQFPPNHFQTWESFSKEFLDHYRRAKEESDLYSILQNMVQKKGEPVQNYIGRLKVTMRRLSAQPSDGQRISWMRKAVKSGLVNVVEQNPTSNADEYERRLIRLEGITQMLQSEKLDGGKEEEKPRRKMEPTKPEEKSERERGDPSSRKFCEIHMRAGHTTQECFQNPLKKKQSLVVNQVGAEDRNRIETNRGLYNPDRNTGRRPFNGGAGRGPLICYYCGTPGHIRGPDCELWTRHQKEKEEALAGPSASVNTVKIATFVVTRSQAQGSSQDLEQAAGDEGTAEDWHRLDATRREAEEQIIREQLGLELPQPEQLVGMEHVPRPEPEILEAAGEFNLGAEHRSGEPLLPQPSAVKGVDLPSLANRLVELISQTKVDMTIAEFFQIAPQCKDMVLKKLSGTRAVEVVPRVPSYQAERCSMNDRGAYVQVSIKGVKMKNVLLDGGSAVNLMSEAAYHRLKDTRLLPAPFNLVMADQRTCHPLGYLTNLPMVISGIRFLIGVIVLRKADSHADQPMLLGRPWLRQAKVKQHWGTDKDYIKIESQGEIYKIRTHPIDEVKGGGAQVFNLNWETGLTEEEEATYLRCRPELSTVTVMELEAVPGGETTGRERMDMELRRDFLEHIQPNGLQECELAASEREITPKEGPMTYEETKTVNLGNEGERREVKISSQLSPLDETALIDLLKEYRDTFAWNYSELKGIPESIGVHKIRLIPGTVPIQAQRYRMNPNYAEKVKEEIQRLLDAKFIQPVNRFTWLSPIVIVPKKNGKLRVCVDYRRLNSATIKDPFPVPFLETVLDSVAGQEVYSFLDGYSGYSQIRLDDEAREKTTFITEWGAFQCLVLPFGLCNGPSTFQRLMMMLFHDYLNDFMQVFLDDFTIYGKNCAHLGHLKLCLQRCREGGVSLNPDKCAFQVPSGRILGHIVSREGLQVDMEKVRAIEGMEAPNTVTKVRRFLGSGGFYRRYIKGYSQITEPLARLTGKNIPFVWDQKCQLAFEELKRRLCSAPILKEPDWSREFHLHTDASQTAVGAVLAQPGSEGIDLPVYYASRLLNAAERNYTTTEREALAMIFAVKKFRHYLLGNKFVFFVDHTALVNLVNKPQLSGRIARWILLLVEFDYTILYKLGKNHLVPDQLSRLDGQTPREGIEDSLPDRLLFEQDQPETSRDSKEEEKGDRVEVEKLVPVHSAENQTTMQREKHQEHLKVNRVDVSNREELERYLRTAEYPEGMSRKVRKVYAQKAQLYTLLNHELYYLGADGVLRRVTPDEERQEAMLSAHDGFGGGHFGVEITTRKILQRGLWWKTMFKDVFEYVKTCDVCQRTGPIKEHMEFRPIIAPHVFQKWGLDFVGPITPPSKYGQHHYIIAATEYTTKWVEAVATRKNNAQVTAQFLYQHIITRYGVPEELVSDQGTHFLNNVIHELTENYKIHHRFSTPYYPQCNGQAESTNKVLLNVLRKVVNQQQNDWDLQLPAVVWAFRTAYKVTTGHTPFQLMFGVEARMPMEWQLPSLRIAACYNINDNLAISQRLSELMRLTEIRHGAEERLERIQLQRKKRIDEQRKVLVFNLNDLVLWCRKTAHIKKGKLRLKWEGPYCIHKVLGNGTYEIIGQDEPEQQLVNGNKLKLYYPRNDSYLEQVREILEGEPGTEGLMMGGPSTEDTVQRPIEERAVNCVTKGTRQEAIERQVRWVIKDIRVSTEGIEEIFGIDQWTSNRKIKDPRCIAFCYEVVIVGISNGRGSAKLLEEIQIGPLGIPCILDRVTGKLHVLLRIYAYERRESRRERFRERQELIEILKIRTYFHSARRLRESREWTVFRQSYYFPSNFYEADRYQLDVTVRELQIVEIHERRGKLIDHHRSMKDLLDLPRTLNLFAGLEEMDTDYQGEQNQGDRDNPETMRVEGELNGDFQLGMTTFGEEEETPMEIERDVEREKLIAETGKIFEATQKEKVTPTEEEKEGSTGGIVRKEAVQLESGRTEEAGVEVRKERATKVKASVISANKSTTASVSKASSIRRVSPRLAEKGTKLKTVSKSNAKRKAVISEDKEELEEPEEIKPKALTKGAKPGVMLFEGVPTWIIKNMRKKAHVEFLKEQGLTEFVKLEWKNHGDLTDAELTEFIMSWRAAKHKGKCQGVTINTDLDHLRSNFSLKKGGTVIKLRENEVYHARTFPRNNTVRGYNILLCQDVNVKQKLEFITHVMHWKKPRSEYPRFMVKLAEDDTGDRKDWAIFFQEGLKSAMKRAKKTKNAGVVMEFKDQLEMLLDTQLRAAEERKAAGEKTPDEEERTQDEEEETEDDEEETAATPIHKRAGRVAKGAKPPVIDDSSEDTEDEPTTPEEKKKQPRVLKPWVEMEQPDADTDFENWVTQHVFGSDEKGIAAGKQLGGLAQVPQEVARIEGDPGYVWLMEHVSKVIAVHQTLKEALEDERVARIKQGYSRSLSLRDGKMVELTAKLREQEKRNEQITDWERAWKHEQGAVEELAKGLSMTEVHEGGLAANLKGIMEELDKRGTAGDNRSSHLEVSQLTLSLNEAIAERDMLQKQLNETIKTMEKAGRLEQQKQLEWEEKEADWKIKEAGWTNSGAGIITEGSEGFNVELKKLQRENDKLSLELEVKEPDLWDQKILVRQMKMKQQK